MIISLVQEINILIKHKLLTRDKSYLFTSELIMNSTTEKIISALRAVLINNSEAISFINFSS